MISWGVLIMIANKYTDGQFINGVKFIRELPHKKIGKRYRRMGLFVCPYCNNNWITTIESIAFKKKGCGKCQWRGTHNLRGTRLYTIWDGVIQRCTNKNEGSYVRYGGRGITICEEWRRNFKSFYDWAMANGYDDSLTLDRKNNNEGYHPGNCRFADKHTQQANRRCGYGTSKFIGVSKVKGKDKWESYITINWKRIHLGHYDSQVDAAKARDKYVKKHKLLEYTLNF